MSANAKVVDQDYEVARLHALRQLDLLDTPPSENFDRITRMASQLFGLPIAAVSLTDTDRQWFKSRVGVDHWSLPRDKAPCAEVADCARPLIVPDLLEHELYRDSPLAASGIRYYAGAPLLTRQGYSLGAMCVLGTEPRETSPEELRLLADLASMVMAQIELQHAMGHVDPVTGLPNRAQFVDDLSDLARDRPEGERRLLVLADIATMEQLDEAARVLGPAYVDGLAREGGRRIAEAIGPVRKVYHVAATQMAFLSLPGVEERAYLDHLGYMLGALRSDADSRFVTSTAVGVVPFALGAIDGDDLLRRASSAAQDARATLSRVGLYSPEVDRGHRRRFTLLNDFGEALAGADQLRLVFQPRVDARSHECLGAEALLRWRHPRLGDIAPGEFIPLVERTALARETTEWVLDAALAQAARWRTLGLDLKLSVNMSAANLDEADFPERLAAKLAHHALPPSCLELELTESAMMIDSSKALELMARIADMGVDLAIDDFGTGYSSLSYLQQLPARVLKIDQSFMRDLDADERKRMLVRTMVELAHKFDYRVVGEGIETEQVLHILALSGCDEAQGYLFARPLESGDFEQWVGRWSPDMRSRRQDARQPASGAADRRHA